MTSFKQGTALKLTEFFRNRLKPAPSTYRSSEVPSQRRVTQVRAGDAARASDPRGIGHTIEQALARARLMKVPPAPTDLGATTPAHPVSPQTRAVVVDDDATYAPSGTFSTKSFGNAAGTRAYKLYVPSTYAARNDAVALVVMLHGCTQSPDDFAAGTRMNELAELHGFLVVYPEQPARANGSRCWNWFMPADQRRDSGEPSLIAGITREVAATYRIDRDRIFVAGLSAGAAMAVVLGETYPDIYAAVGAHSGLPFGIAQDVPSAFNAMKNAGVNPSRATLQTNVPIEMRQRRRMPRTIIFHGDTDSTVNVENARTIEADALRATPAGTAFLTTTEDGRSAAGRSYTRIAHVDADGSAHVERWILHGAGHAWAGGSRAGSFTDPTSVDASAEMIRFFGAGKLQGAH